MKPLIYVAGPITRDPLGAVRDAAPAFDWVREAGGVPVIPHWSIVHEMVSHVPYEDWLAYDYDLILHCQALLRLPGDSPGADREVSFARGKGIPIFTQYGLTGSPVQGTRLYQEVQEFCAHRGTLHEAHPVL